MGVWEGHAYHDFYVNRGFNPTLCTDGRLKGHVLARVEDPNQSFMASGLVPCVIGNLYHFTSLDGKRKFLSYLFP